ncbi:hypothetical protein F4553_002457 [Allocatelliglobosispora scoriae]|uniref:N-acetylmuramoyl-L-alanine amidase n=1 Tax=Allocatelliglobosispora scoriae TaxID=643052 RepID=A0A841BNW2_9ACTN|nr:N-acetylmuramoyl-L-alanine amidase [Allocatelliglobosispora scoriae]MBB5869078.1 hypothetical protein [Allocatelliglobosispora scoriae]
MRRRVSVRLLAVVAATAIAASAPIPASAEPEATGRQGDYAAAATEFGVPESILLGVSYLESRWDVNGGAPSTSGGYGPMHLTDAAYVSSLPGGHHDDADEDPRGDDSRPFEVVPVQTAPAPDPASMRTLTAAAELIGVSEASLREDPAVNIRGGAALLAAYQSGVQGPTGAASDPAAWFGAVAKYSGADNADAAAAFADEVYATIAAGAARTTDDGEAVTLPARAVHPIRDWLDRLGLRKLARPDGLECPVELSCEWIPAPYQSLGANPTAYGNHDTGNRPQQQKIEYIVIHSTEGSYNGTINMVQDPTYVSWNYTLRSVDGHIAQHVKAKDVAWHAGNWYVNAKAIGLEHEGYAARQGAWFTEAMYRSSAKLVRYLALRLGIPLDRQHIIGHDNVNGTTPAGVQGMHWDPGPYWDWSHYFDLLGRPFRGVGTPHAGLVTINPDYESNQPAFYGCVSGTTPCVLHGSSSVILHTAPDAASPLLADKGRNPTRPASTMLISDHGARASTGQQYAVAEIQGDWTAIWYLGQKGWFYNPPSAPSALWSLGFIATPKAGRATVPVYGRAYPEAAAYPTGVPVQALAPLTQYTFAAGEKYSVGLFAPSEYYRSSTFAGTSPGDWTVISGTTKYAQIQFGHRIAYVNLADVDIRLSLR